jgi:iron only hydrogenase large subunit-like protein
MSSVFISNVDDYLAPSQACVNPLFSESVNSEAAAAATAATEGVVVARKPIVRRGKRPLATIPAAPVPTETAKVSMADCLACSGCVTTAETVLVEQHSLKTLHEIVAKKNDDALVCMTLSPASVADLLRHLQVSSNDSSTVTIQRKLVTFLNVACQASLVVDGQVPLSWSLIEASREFVHCYRRHRQVSTTVSTTAPAPSIAVSALQSQLLGPKGPILVTHETGRNDHSSLPLVSATCPALVCLVEKSHAAAVSHLASTKSPMSMAGAYYKHMLRSTDILHIAIMPCHDKKLEASRKDLAWNEIPDVDLVLTTTELLQLLGQTCGSPKVDDMRTYLDGLEAAPMIKSLLDYTIGTVAWVLDSTAPQQSSGPKTSDFYAYSSGGYADFIFQYACQELFSYTVPGGNVPWKAVESTQRQSARTANRKRDYHHVTLYQHADGTYSTNADYKKVLSFCTAYGLQTMQRILQPFDKGEFSPYDYIEAMACPSGCLNGGGQIRLSDREAPSETRMRVASSQAMMEQSCQRQATSPGNMDIYNDRVEPFGQEAQKLLHTRYHVVPPLQFSIGAAAGVAVQHTQW